MKRSLWLGLILALALINPSQAATSDQPERVYFVMLDRFSNGDTGNDWGGAPTPAAGGFNPADPGFWHGGDIKGLSQKLEYIHELGFTAIWISPVVRNQVLSVDGNSAGYHGYWGLGFDEVDPHFGTLGDFTAMVQRAHSLDLKVILDIVVNHTADVIDLHGGSFYTGNAVAPYRTCDGKPFDAKKLEGSNAFPVLESLCADTSFPKHPIVSLPNATAKSPGWLNDVRLYHNRGNSTFSGESSQWGDFYGLDDLFTENPIVVRGMISLWSQWIRETDIDGLRVDTARHVNEGFWKEFIPGVQQAARELGKPNFPIWGEVYDSDPSATAYWSVEGHLTGILDFGFQERVQQFVTQGQSAPLADLFDADDYYFTSNRNVNQWGTFLGNHDMGRIGSFVHASGGTKSRDLARDQLAHAMLFLLRGSPIVYYGDEFGLTGGSDKAARQDLFATSVPAWSTEYRIGGEVVGPRESFALSNPIQTSIRALNDLRSRYPVLGTGSQQTRYAKNGVFVASRFDWNERREYVIAFNANASLKSVSVPLGSASTWRRLAGTGTLSKRGVVTLPGYSYAFFSADRALSTSGSVKVTVNPLSVSSELSGRVRITARVTGAAPVAVEFHVLDHGVWVLLGEDRTANFGGARGDGLFRIYPPRSVLPSGPTISVKVTARTVDGKVASTVREMTAALK